MFNVHIVHISDEVLHEGEAERVVLPGVLGDFEIVDLHAPIVSLLARGKISVKLPQPVQVEEGSSETYQFKKVSIEQGLMRFDGKELFAVVE